MCWLRWTARSCATFEHWRTEMRSARGSGCCANSIPRARAPAISTSPTPTTGRATASRRCSISCIRHARGCSRRSRRARFHERAFMSLPAGASVLARVGGGDINEAFRVRLADGGEAFVKTRAGAAPGEYAAEAAGLRWLAEPGALRTPRVLALEDGYLALEWVERGYLNAASVEEVR